MEEDKITRWARPSIIWLGLLLVVVTDVILPVISQLCGLNLSKLSIDPNFWDAWNVIVGIYVGGRTLEKTGLPGSNRKGGSQPGSQGEENNLKG